MLGNRSVDVLRIIHTILTMLLQVFNVSERRSALRKLNPQVLELGWPSGLAPPLERLCALCKAADCWLQADPRHIVVIHAKGDKGRVGVVLAAYMHYSSICASADQALDRFAMRRVYEDKLAPALKPSQKRYVHYFSGLLSGAIKMNNNTLYLHQVVVHRIPGTDSKGGCRPFLKIYTGMQPVYTTGVYLANSRTQRVTVGLNPSVALRGDVLVICYHKSPEGRTLLFRLQFHTCTVDGGRCLTFRREDLDLPTDSSFDKDGKVELQFSYNPEDCRGSHHDVMVPVENAEDSSLVRWDSFETFNIAGEDEDDDEMTDLPHLFKFFKVLNQ
ncbi:TNS1 [Cordylochernes scorpioides]|uniref:TNS1 n=1 Tax=Cordylochernes scorpioides TaxID=51811 RepID=A0ABY6L5Q1_9ARAC|nr:TNS1 [Cordylochernes scorpioides]